MRIIMNVVLGLLLAVAFAACQKANDPVSPILANKTDIISSQLAAQSYDGNFEATFNNYRNANITTTINGTIDFIFSNDNYSYSGQVSDGSEDVILKDLHDTGTYSLHNNIITLSDNATKMMNAGWLPSLYLSGDYNYIHQGDQVIIEGRGTSGTVKIVLKPTAVGR